MRVRVPFGRETLIGYIVRVTEDVDVEDAQRRIKEVLGRIDDEASLPPEIVTLTEWVAEHYLAPLGQCLRLAFPGAPDGRRIAPTSSTEPEIHQDPQPRALGGQAAPVLEPAMEEVADALTAAQPVKVLLPVATHQLQKFLEDAIPRVLNARRTALILVPEIHRVPVIQGMLGRWRELCEVYHGGLPASQRRAAWTRIREGAASIVIGTRSAVFAPLTHLGLVLVDQEDHHAYKAENTPRYDARAVASERARLSSAVMVFASAHPSVATVHATGSPEGFGSERQASPRVTVVDLRASAAHMLAPALAEAIGLKLERREKSLLFLNRKGYAPVLVCRDCGQAIRCPECAIGWTYHKQTRMLRCAHCGREAIAPDVCPSCAGTRIVPGGFGTEALEEAVRVQFPAARVARLEQDARARKHKNPAILTLMAAGELDILIGTQLVLTAHPRPVASLIALVYPDAALHLPDFRAAEHAYHMFREVMTLADSADADIVIQTNVPEHHVMQALAAGDPSIFYQNELADRAALGYPPFGRLIGLRVSGTREELVIAAGARWAELLRSEMSKQTPSVQVLGPIAATPARLRGRIRWQLIVKGTDDAAMRHAVKTTLTQMESAGRTGGLRYDVDVDPQSLIG